MLVCAWEAVAVKLKSEWEKAGIVLDGLYLALDFMGRVCSTAHVDVVVNLVVCLETSFFIQGKPPPLSLPKLSEQAGTQCCGRGS